MLLSFIYVCFPGIMQENLNVLLERAEKEALTKVCKIIDFMFTQDTKSNHHRQLYLCIIILSNPTLLFGENTVQVITRVRKLN